MADGKGFDELVEMFWEEYHCHCINNHLEFLEREEYIPAVREYYQTEIEAQYKAKVRDNAFAARVGKQLFFPIRGREPKTYYHLQTLLLPLNPNFRRFYRQPYFEMVRKQYPEHRVIHSAVLFNDSLKVKLIASDTTSPIITLPIQVLTGFYENCFFQRVQFQSDDDAMLFFQLLLGWEGFEEAGSYCDVRCHTEKYIAYQYRGNKKVIFEDNTMTSFYFPGGIDFTETFELNFDARSLV